MSYLSIFKDIFINRMTWMEGFLRAHLRPSYGEKQSGVLRMCTIPVILLWST